MATRGTRSGRPFLARTCRGGDAAATAAAGRLVRHNRAIVQGHAAVGPHGHCSPVDRRRGAEGRGRGRIRHHDADHCSDDCQRRRAETAIVAASFPPDRIPDQTESGPTEGTGDGYEQVETTPGNDELGPRAEGSRVQQSGVDEWMDFLRTANALSPLELLSGNPAQGFGDSRFPSSVRAD